MTKTRCFRFTVVVLLLTGLIAQRVPTAQAASETATASAEMVTPLVIVFQTPLDFGDFTVGPTGGTVIVSPAQFGPKSTTGDVSWITAISAGRGSFGLQGEPNRAYQNTGSQTTVTLSELGGSTMTANLIYFSDTAGGPVSGAGGQLNGSGMDVLGFAGTLNVNANQTPGAYTGTFNVTVDY
ncbi:MAG: hypothetical protein NPINA01_09110 [Nitrospinaceae bacterium]|nr:MAG: hypothetical protein NPINA01_09110 [Nitrospinaceae bacterium]